MPRRNSIPRVERVAAVAVNDASVERLRVLPEDEWHLRRGARVSALQGDSRHSKSRSRRVSPCLTCFSCRGCWFLYQLRQISQIFRSAFNTSVLNLEQARAQYIYIDDPRFKGESSRHDVYLSDNHNRFVQRLIVVLLWFQTSLCSGRMRIYMDHLRQKSQETLAIP